MIAGKWTPGPWKMEQDYRWPFRLHVLSADSHTVVAEFVLSHSTDDLTAADTNCREGNDELHANARLIAAAPEMAEALEACVPILAAIAQSDLSTATLAAEIWGAARAALNKAKGVTK